jgi:hypothetical protein
VGSKGKFAFFTSVILMCLMLPNMSLAQSSKKEEKGTSSVSFTTGPLLPQRVPGLREIMPMNGVRYSNRFRIGQLELEYLGGNASGSFFHSASMRLRYDIGYDDFLSGLFLVGADSIIYQKILKITTITLNTDGSSTSEVTFEPSDVASFSGMHFGFSLIPKISKTLRARADMIMRFSPGTSVFIGLGIEKPF